MKLPLPFSNALRYPAGVDAKGCDLALKPKPNSFLFNPDGSVGASWYDGSKDKPIITPNFQECNAASSVLVQDEAGRWYRMVPTEIGGAKKILVYEAGAAFFEDVNQNQLSFDVDSVVSNGDCDFFFAVFSACGEGAGTLTLKKATKEELFPDGEFEDAASAGYDGISLTRDIDGVPTRVSVRPTCGKMIKSCCDAGGENPKWFVVDSGQQFYKATTQIGLVVGANVNLPGYADALKLACGKTLHAVISADGTVAAAAGNTGAYHYAANGINLSHMVLSDGGVDGFCVPWAAIPMSANLIAIGLTYEGSGSITIAMQGTLLGWLA